MSKVIDLPQRVAPDIRAVLALYADALRGKIRRKSLDAAMLGERVKPTVEIDIVRRLSREIRKRIDATVPEALRERARVAHMRGCLRGRIAAILGCTPYEAEVWANLSTPRERVAPTETESEPDA